MKHLRLAVVLVLASFAVAAAAQEPAQPATFDQVMDRAMQQEAQFLKTLKDYQPLVETYIQNQQIDKENVAVPVSDRYFLGRLTYDTIVKDTTFTGDAGAGADQGKKKSKKDKKNKDQQAQQQPQQEQQKSGGGGGFFSFYKHLWPKGSGGGEQVDFLALGFAQMVLVDGRNFDREHYDFKFLRREFLGEVRTIVVDVSPKKNSGDGRFLGRIWIEDQNYNIVRFNGTYYPQPKKGVYLHFDSWRLNMAPGLWLPAYIYSEESDLQLEKKQTLHFKSQTRLWGYNVKGSNQQQEFSQILVDSNDAAVKDQSQNVQDLSPVNSKRQWERQAEDNVLDRLQQASLLSAPGEVDKVLQTVVNNLEITNNLNIEPEIRCRVLMTTPLELITIGHTIVLSRGLLDTLPDEATLAMVLAHEVAHIALDHTLDTKFAFADRMIFSDEMTYNKMKFAHPSQEEEAADAKALELLQNSPYKDKLASAGLFLRQLDARRAVLPALIRARLGNSMLDNTNQPRMHELMATAPELKPKDTTQIAALPLGGRIKVDAFNNKLDISKNKPVALLSAREKMPFEVTPMFPYLTRINQPPATKPTADGQ